jgi:hypothetical protein
MTSSTLGERQRRLVADISPGGGSLWCGFLPSSALSSGELFFRKESDFSCVDNGLKHGVV